MEIIKYILVLLTINLLLGSLGSMVIDKSDINDFNNNAQTMMNQEANSDTVDPANYLSQTGTGSVKAMSNNIWSVLRGAVDLGIPEDNYDDEATQYLAWALFYIRSMMGIIAMVLLYFVIVNKKVDL